MENIPVFFYNDVLLKLKYEINVRKIEIFRLFLGFGNNNKSTHMSMYLLMYLHSIVAWMSRNSLLKTGAESKVQVTATGLEPITI